MLLNTYAYLYYNSISSFFSKIPFTRYFQIIASQYIWFLLICIPLISLKSIHKTQVVPDFTKQNDRIKNYSQAEVKCLLHISDLHLSHKRVRAVKDITARVRDINQKYKPDRIIITGDLTDNAEMSVLYPYRTQIERDWIHYKQFLIESGIKLENLIQVSGNHDIFNLLEFNSSLHYANGIVYNESNYTMSLNFFNESGEIIKFVAINPFKFPSPPIAFLRHCQPEDKFYSMLDHELKKNDSDHVIVVSHCAGLRFLPSRHISKVLSQSTKIRYFLSGHWHPKKHSFFHYGSTLEVVSPPLFRQVDTGLIFIDEGHFSYHVLNDFHLPDAFITSPIPSYQETLNERVVQSTGEIHLINFNKARKNFTISGELHGYMNCKNMNEYQKCIFPYSNLVEGEHDIMITGLNFRQKLRFVVGPNVKGFSEKHYSYVPTYQWFFIFYISIIPLYYILWPTMQESKGLKPIVADKNEMEINWMNAIIGLPLFRKRILRLPSIIRYLYQLSLAWVTFLPMLIFYVEESPYALFSWGYFMNSKIKVDYNGAMFATSFVYYILYPTLIMFSGLIASSLYKYSFMIDLIVYVISYYGLFNALFDVMHQFGFLATFTSPCFFFFPSLMHFSLLFWSYIAPMQYDSEIQDEYDDREELSHSLLYDFEEKFDAT